MRHVQWELVLEVLDERESFSPGHCADIGAVMTYLHITPWQVEGFDPTANRERLLALYHRMQAESGLATRLHHFFVAARRPAG